MGKWIGNKYHEDEEGDEICGRTFCGYASKTEFCQDNNITRTELEKILVILKNRCKTITLYNILHEKEKLLQPTDQLTPIKDIEEDNAKEDNDNKKIKTGRPSKPFLDCSSITEWCKKNNTCIKTVQKIVQQLTEQGIEITKENIFKQRDFNRHNTQAFRKDRANPDIKQISSVTQTGKANCGRVAGGCELETDTEDHDKVEKEEVKKDDDMMKQDDNVSVANAIKETANNNEKNNTDNQVSISPQAFEFLLDTIVERRVKEGIDASKYVNFLAFVVNVGQVVAFILSFIAFSLLMTVLCLRKYGFIKAVIN